MTAEQTPKSLSSSEGRWGKILALCVAVAAAALSFAVGLGFVWSSLAFVILAFIGWSVESRMDTRSYLSSPGPTGVPWRCDLDGRQFPSHQAALDHAQHQHPERDVADAQSHLSVAAGLAPTS